jgi:hypothetical protein
MPGMNPGEAGISWRGCTFQGLIFGERRLLRNGLMFAQSRGPRIAERILRARGMVAEDTHGNGVRASFDAIQKVMHLAAGSLSLAYPFRNT